MALRAFDRTPAARDVDVERVLVHHEGPKARGLYRKKGVVVGRVQRRFAAVGRLSITVHEPKSACRQVMGAMSVGARRRLRSAPTTILDEVDLWIATALQKDGRDREDAKPGPTIPLCAIEHALNLNTKRHLAQQVW